MELTSVFTSSLSSNRSLMFLILSPCGFGDTNTNPAQRISLWLNIDQPESIKLNSYIWDGTIGKQSMLFHLNCWQNRTYIYNRTTDRHFAIMREETVQIWSHYRQKQSRERKPLYLMTSFESLDQTHVWNHRLFRYGVNTCFFSSASYQLKENLP